MKMRSAKFVVVGLAALAVVAAGCALQSGSTSGGGISTRQGAGVRAGVEGSTEDRFAATTGDGAIGAGGDSRTMTVAERAAAAGLRVGPDGRDQFGRPSPTVFATRPELRDIYFDFDRSDIRVEAASVLDETAGWLKENPAFLVLIEGHADERGTNEYNIALGDRRAKAVMNYLVSHGVRAKRVSIVSYGEERPVCGEGHEGCWSLNRRAHFSVLNQ